ncbi:hypothetical protein LMG29542_08231 [Paraburkholderia humisilvae]|uniref:Cupin 2 conserved barrel domain-containing protein n=1 Tax=Paraburkholderia humisilvae TaxID=627669 RepID=A0A6J5F7R2_9BURK|nr:hypothetical protein LMG29542_08231 [Paraburkholderia humisilvae]
MQSLFKRSLLVLSAGLIGACVVPAFAQTTGASIYKNGGKPTVLLHTDKSWNGTLYPAYPSGQPQLTVLELTTAPHAKTPWHTHPAPCAAYIATGKLTVETKDGLRKTVSQGEVLPELVGPIHRGIAGDTPTKLLLFCAGVSGSPFALNAK